MRRRLLVVDDDEHVLKAERRALFGYDVVAVTSAEEALERVTRGETFDAVITDILMPGVDGHELARRLAEVAPDLADRLLFLTGDPSLAKVQSLHGHPIVGKPIETHLLRSRLDHLVQASAARKKLAVPAADMPTVRPPAARSRDHEDD
jgi:CheY-like chemotaxis protein